MFFLVQVSENFSTTLLTREASTSDPQVRNVARFRHNAAAIKAARTVFLLTVCHQLLNNGSESKETLSVFRLQI